MGTLIAQEMAINNPNRVMRLVLISGWACQDDDVNGFTPEALEAAKLPFQQAMPRLADYLLNKPFNRFILVPLFKMQFRRIKEPQIAGLMGQMGCSAGFDSVDRLQTIKAPTLILAGTKDRMIKQPGSSETIAARIPNTKLVKVINGSHALSTETAGVVNKEVTNFLKGN
jgi:pimeloyl-ACP methyl ester carboxylesterase